MRANKEIFAAAVTALFYTMLAKRLFCLFCLVHNKLVRLKNDQEKYDYFFVINMLTLVDFRKKTICEIYNCNYFFFACNHL
jgi:hypothetical protein